MTRKKGPTSDPSFRPEGDDPAHEANVSPEEKVGYGRPPAAGRFKPGQSGNPRGRPKGAKSLDQVLRQALDRRVPDPRRGGRHTVRMIELIVEGLVLGAAKRDPRMVRLLLALIDRCAASDASAEGAEEIRSADKQIIDEFIGSLIPASGKKGKP